MSFRGEIKAIRQKCYLSQEAFAKELGVVFATVNRWESGKTKPTYKAMKSIKEFCEANSIDSSVLEKEWFEAGKE